MTDDPTQSTALGLANYSTNPDDLTRLPFGRALRCRREALSLTQQQLAKRIGVTQGAVAKWELRNMPLTSLEHVRALSEILSATVYEVLNGMVPRILVYKQSMVVTENTDVHDDDPISAVDRECLRGALLDLEELFLIDRNDFEIASRVIGALLDQNKGSR
jgi:transcriptional regulator with XRE-family HTH domain